MDQMQENITKWQRVLNLSDWEIDSEFVEFSRADGFPQRGDIKVDLESKEATILLKEDQEDIEKTVLHELIHLLLWNLDHYAEERLNDDQKEKYFDNLESTVANLTDIIYKSAV